MVTLCMLAYIDTDTDTQTHTDTQTEIDTQTERWEGIMGGSLEEEEFIFS